MCQCVNRQWIERDLIILEEVGFVVFHFSLISENAKPDISCEMCACTTMSADKLYKRFRPSSGTKKFWA